MAFTARITVYPDVPGGFGPGSFTDLVQHEVDLPGLDSTWTHTLIAVSVAGDGGSADLTVVSEPSAAMSLTHHLRVVGTPAAHVRVVDTSGATLVETATAAPLYEGQTVAVGDRHFLVQSVGWPGRHPETGACAGDLDWQHVTVTEQPRPAVAPSAATP